MKLKLIKLMVMALLACGNFHVLADNCAVPNAVILLMKDGSEMAFSLSSRPKVTYTDDCSGIVINDGNEKASFEITSVSKFIFGDRIDVGVEKVATFPNFNIIEGQLLCNNLPENSVIKIFNMEGKNMGIYKVTENNCEINLERLTSGIYIVNTAGGTFKIVKK